MTSDRLAGYSRLMATLTLLLIAGMLLLNAACWIFPDLASEHGLGFALTATGVAGDTGGGESETEAVLAGKVGEDPARGVEQQHAGDQQQGQGSHQAAVAGQAVACHRGYSWEGGQAPRKRGKPK